MENNTPKRGFVGLWIPAAIVQDLKLTMLEKMLYAEIDALDKGNEDGTGCFASNEYLSEMLGSTENSISNAISTLKDTGYITQTSFDGRKRYLKSNFLPTRKSGGSLPEKVEAESTNSCTIDNSIENRLDSIPQTPLERGSEKAIEAYYERKKTPKIKAQKQRPESFEMLVALFTNPGSVKDAFVAWDFCQSIDGEKQETMFSEAQKYVKQKGQFQISACSWLEQRHRQNKLKASFSIRKPQNRAFNWFSDARYRALSQNASFGVIEEYKKRWDFWRQEAAKNGWSNGQLAEAIENNLKNSQVIRENIN